MFTRATSSTLEPVVSAADGITVRHIHAGPVRGADQGGAAGPALRVRPRGAARRGRAAGRPLRRGALALLAVRPGRRAGPGPLGRAAGPQHAHDGEGQERRARRRRHPRAPGPADRRGAGGRGRRHAHRQHRHRGQAADRASTTPTRGGSRWSTPGSTSTSSGRWPAAEARAGLGLPVDADVLLFAGRIQPLKAPDVLLRAVAELLERDPRSCARGWSCRSWAARRAPASTTRSRWPTSPPTSASPTSSGSCRRSPRPSSPAGTPRRPPSPSRPTTSPSAWSPPRPRPPAPRSSPPRSAASPPWSATAQRPARRRPRARGLGRRARAGSSTTTTCGCGWRPARWSRPGCSRGSAPPTGRSRSTSGPAALLPRAGPVSDPAAGGPRLPGRQRASSTTSPPTGSSRSRCRARRSSRPRCGSTSARHALGVHAFVCRNPDENHERVYRWLLERNLRMYAVSFAVDRLGDIYLDARLPLSSVDPRRARPAARLGADLRRRVVQHDPRARLRLLDPQGVGVAQAARRADRTTSRRSAAGSRPDADSSVSWRAGRHRGRAAAGSAWTTRIRRLTVAAPYTPATTTQPRKNSFTSALVGDQAPDQAGDQEAVVEALVGGQHLALPRRTPASLPNVLSARSASSTGTSRGPGSRGAGRRPAPTRTSAATLTAVSMQGGGRPPRRRSCGFRRARPPRPGRARRRRTPSPAAPRRGTATPITIVIGGTR